VPVQTTRVSTTDADVAHDALNRMYAPERPTRYSGAAEDFRFELTAWQDGDLHLAQLEHRMTTRAEAMPVTDFMVGWVGAGGMRWNLRGNQFALGPGTVARYPVGEAMAAEWSSIELLILRIPMSTVRAAAETRLGMAVPQLSFSGLNPVSGAATATWEALLGYLASAFSRGEAKPDHPLMLAGLMEVIATTALVTFPNSTMTAAYWPGPGRVATPAVRRAVEYIDAHPGDPIGLAEIAVAAGTTGRAVQLAFRRHLDLTPMAYLRRVRLERAHRDLEDAEPGDGATVSGIAARWGFGHAGRFGHLYLQRYGVPPSRTLRG
jgi:AraC-like DNA-binding protein